MKVTYLVLSGYNKSPALSGEERYQIEGISNAVALLRRFSRTSSRKTLTELASEAGMSNALTRRTLETLAQHDFIKCVAPDEYELGFGWLSLADIRRRQVGMRQIAYPVMRALRDRLNETIILSIRSGFKRISIDYVESSQSIRRTAQSGFEAPLHIGSAGKVLLAGLSANDLEIYFDRVPLIAFDNSGYVEKNLLRTELEAIHKCGYSIAYREITPDAAAISAPLYDHHGNTCAVVTVSLPADRFSDRLKAQCIRELLKGTLEISTHLGFSVINEQLCP